MMNGEFRGRRAGGRALDGLSFVTLPNIVATGALGACDPRGENRKQGACSGR